MNSYLGISFSPLIIIVLIWSLIWKGLALYQAGKRQEPWWFVILLIVNTLGILEIVYIFFVAKRDKPKISESETIGHE
jgi:hypothetical protein